MLTSFGLPSSNWGILSKYLQMDSSFPEALNSNQFFFKNKNKNYSPPQTQPYYLLLATISSRLLARSQTGLTQDWDPQAHTKLSTLRHAVYFRIYIYIVGYLQTQRDHTQCLLLSDPIGIGPTKIGLRFRLLLTASLRSEGFDWISLALDFTTAGEKTYHNINQL